MQRRGNQQLDWFRELRDSAESTNASVDREIETLLASLDSSAAMVRRAAADLLGLSSEPAVATTLLSRAVDEDKNVRNAVAASLARLAANFAEAQAVLSDNLLSEAFRVRFASARAWHGTSNELALLTIDEIEGVRWAAFQRLATRALNGRPVDAELLIPGLRDPAAAIRRAATRGLSALAFPTAIEVLTEALRDDDPGVRAWAIAGLRHTGDARIVEPLRPLLADPAPGIRAQACYAIHSVDREAGVKAAIALLRDRKRPIRERAAELLGEWEAVEAVDPLIDLLQRSTKITLRAKAAWALGEIGEPSAIPALTRALEDDRPARRTLYRGRPLTVRRRAQEALAKIERAED